MLEKSENIIDSGKADQDQRDRKSSYRTLLENLPDIVYRLQLQGSRPMQFFNDRITEITGFSPDEFTLGRICFIESRMMKEDASRVIETVEKAIRERSPFEVEYRFLCKDGAIITLMEKGTVVCDATGAPSYIDGVIRDISDRKAMEDALRQSEDRYKAIVDSQAEFVVRYLPGGIVTFVNDTLCRYVGMKRKDLLGKSYYPFMHPDDRDTFVRKIEALNRNTPDMVAEARVVLPDGRLAWHRWSHHAIFDKDGALVEYQCTGRDVTDLKLAENKLRKSEESYRALVETANSVILTWDTEGNLMFVNDFAERFFGYTKEELIGRNVVGTIVPETESSGRNLALLMREIQKDPDGFRDNENENITKDGRRVWVQWANKALVDDKDKLTGILSIGNDITERKRTEEALQKSEKMLQTIIDAEPECVKLLDENGLKCCGMHLELKALASENLPRTIENNQQLGNEYLNVAAAKEKMETDAGITELANILNETAEKCRAHKMAVGYHAHPFDFVKIDGRFAWELLFSRTKPEVSMQMDVGNCLGGNGDPIGMLKQFPARTPTIHIKEYKEKTFDSDYYTQVFALCEGPCKTKWYIVEMGSSEGTGFDVPREALDKLKRVGK